MLPNATETRIVVTGNYRAWRHFIAMRASEHADVEIRRLAIECLRQLVDVAPAGLLRLRDLRRWPTAARWRRQPAGHGGVAELAGYRHGTVRSSG